MLKKAITADTPQAPRAMREYIAGGCGGYYRTQAGHDYSRIWSRLKPADRNRRLSEALRRLAKGETLAQVAATWRASTADLCRALLGHAPNEWSKALAARALVRFIEAGDAHLKEPRNSMARAKALALRWHLEYALQVFCPGMFKLAGWEIVGSCPRCEERSVYLAPSRPARCCECGWQGNARKWLLRAALPNPPVGPPQRGP